MGATYEAEECGELDSGQSELLGRRCSSTHGLLLGQIAGSSQHHYDGVLFELHVARSAYLSDSISPELHICPHSRSAEGNMSSGLVVPAWKVAPVVENALSKNLDS
jgi:hypothetical protein